MTKRKDKGLRAWRAKDPYVARSRKTAVDPRFHTIEQKNFYETVLLEKMPAMSEMKWVD